MTTIKTMVVAISSHFSPTMVDALLLTGFLRVSVLPSFHSNLGEIRPLFLKLEAKYRFKHSEL